MPNCDPRDHFVYDSKTVELTDEIGYWTFQDTETASAEAKKKSADLSFTINGVPGTFNYDEASQIASRFRLTTASSLRRKQTQTMFEQHLSQGAVDAYIACLRGVSPVVVRVSSLTADWDSVAFEVEWYVPAHQIKSAQMHISVRGGKLDNGKTEKVQEWGKGDRDIIRVQRTAGEEISLIARIDGQASECQVPTKPIVQVPNRVLRDIEMVGLIRGEYYGTDVAEGIVRIDAEPGTILVPSTARAVPMLKHTSRTDRPIDEVLIAEVLEAKPLFAIFRTKNLHGNNPGRSVIQGRAQIYQIGNWG